MNKQRYIFQHPAYKYASDVASGKTVASKYVRKVCKDFIDELHNRDSDYWFDDDLLYVITKILHLVKFGDGFCLGEPVSDHLIGFQWLFISNILCWKHADDHQRRRYTKGLMLIARKNGKTFLVALMFILLLLTEPQNSTFFSVAPDLQLSSIVKQEMQNLLDGSPALVDKFKWTKKKVICKYNHNTFQPLATSNDRMDGRQAGVFVADEVGALKNAYPIQAMQSSQLTVANPLGVLISTAYPTLNNPMKKEVVNAEKRIKQGRKHNDQFALLFKPDNPTEWKDSDDELMKCNPLAQDVPRIKSTILGFRQDAIDMPDNRSNFLTKHMNIFVDGDVGEQYVTKTQLDNCELGQPFDWRGRDVYVGMDLSQSNDNTGISMTCFDKDRQTYVAKSWAFYPINRQAEKKRVEHIDYALMDKQGYSFGCGAMTIDYKFVEDFICNLERKYGVHVKAIAYDRWNALATVNHLKAKGYTTVEVRQNARGLYGGTKLLREHIENGQFAFDKNDLLKENFLNATMVFDMNKSYYLNKKKSNGKIDMVASLVNTMCLWNRDVENNASDFMPDVVF